FLLLRSPAFRADHGSVAATAALPTAAARAEDTSAPQAIAVLPAAPAALPSTGRVPETDAPMQTPTAKEEPRGKASNDESRGHGKAAAASTAKAAPDAKSILLGKPVF